jgi:hypothetical protein
MGIDTKSGSKTTKTAPAFEGDLAWFEMEKMERNTNHRRP